MDVRTSSEQIRPLLDVEGAAELLNVSPYTVRAWIRSGRLLATKLGRLVRVEPSEVEKLIDAGRGKENHTNNEYA